MFRVSILLVRLVSQSVNEECLLLLRTFKPEIAQIEFKHNRAQEKLYFRGLDTVKRSQKLN